MKGITERPAIKAERWYSGAEAARLLEMDYVTFWRMRKRGYIERGFPPLGKRAMYQGKVLLKFWSKWLLPR